MRQYAYPFALLVSLALSACDGGETELDASVESDGGTDASVDIDASVESDGGIDASVGCTDTDPCDDGDPCTEGDVCNSGICVGTAVVCDTPDAPTCTDDNTLRTFSPSGSCSAGMCSYPPSDMGCLDGCFDGACLVSPFEALDAYIKASNAGADDGFGASVALGVSGIHQSGQHGRR